ncbi:hypothetical protein DENSPDRAFT_886463 [Dentipellis sp. KUC8613]|nr:hypothetical protein DENSPDRAFT_886463 [Dentipellis sp. KUC8613]
MTICAFLSHAGSADTLKLEIPANTHRWCPPGMFFANLTILHITVEHHALVPFLSTHKAITNLSLGACGCRTSCPLQGIVLPHLAYLVCPPGCVRGLLNNNPVTDLVMKYQSPEDMRFSTSTVVRQGPFLSTVPITRLHADFDPTDSDFLLFLFKIAPDLQILYLRQSVWCYSARVSRPIWRRQVDLFKDLSLLDISINDELAPTKHDEDAYLRTLLPPLPAFILRGRLLNFLRVSTRLREDSWYDRQWNIVDTTWTKTVNHE